jgi:hypothetical protein
MKIDLVGDSPIFEIEYSNLEQRSIFSKKSTQHLCRGKMGVEIGGENLKKNLF